MRQLFCWLGCSPCGITRRAAPHLLIVRSYPAAWHLPALEELLSSREVLYSVFIQVPCVRTLSVRCIFKSFFCSFSRRTFPAGPTHLPYADLRALRRFQYIAAPPAASRASVPGSGTSAFSAINRRLLSSIRSPSPSSHWPLPLRSA